MGLEDARLARLVAVIRTVAELLDNCTDGLVSSVIAATMLLLVIIALHGVADALESCPDVLTLYTPRLKGADLR
ncbi:hypothetical protein [Nonomuraea diastatica]|uniref:Uncharacterized protein n=1 Tax=Nonomuraea diastatica TaxID=1848329 RepID=A0A4R4WX11_9ACTN|nr:hypothetical protein [Nonomuraea diastatica]TDD22258.1 hypothetical protein E1294_12440 [Nonomuraea diastatica]